MRMMTLSLAAALCAFTPALSQAAKGDPEMILPKLHAINLSEIEAGDLAARKACRADVKNFGRIVARDHRALDVTVQRLSRLNRIQLNEVFVDDYERQNFLKQENDNRRLRQMDGCVDRAFLRSMRDAHVFSYRVMQEALADPASAPLRRDLLVTRSNVIKHYNMSVNLLRGNTVAGKEEQGKEEGKEEQQQEEQKQEEQNQQDQGMITFIGKEVDEAKDEQKEEQQEEQKQEEQNQQDQGIVSFLGKEVDDANEEQKEEQNQEEQKQEEQNQQDQGFAYVS